MVADASTNDQNQSSEGFLGKCLFGRPNSGIEEMACNVAKTTTEGLVILGACYTANAMATSIFPPAIALAPLCNFLGVGGLVSKPLNLMLQVD